MADGTLRQSNFAYFTVAEAAQEDKPVTAPVAMYSYSSDMRGAKPLAGATLDRTTVYVEWVGDYSRVKTYCCKATDSMGNVIAPHAKPKESHVYRLDLSSLDSGNHSRELYADLYSADGQVQQNNFSSFVVAQAATPPPAEPGSRTSDITVEWTAPSQRENGDYLSISELKGYEIYYTTDISGKSAVINVKGGHTNKYDIDDLPADIYYFTMSAIDNEGLKSRMTDIIELDLR
jgi:hypothetical protein